MLDEHAAPVGVLQRLARRPRADAQQLAGEDGAARGHGS
jgi:hypothetical protein